MKSILRLIMLLALVGCQATNLPTPASQPAPTPRPATAQPITPPAQPSPAQPATARPTIQTPTPRTAPLAWGYPLGQSGRPAGDGFFIRHGYSTENTWYNPGYWHTGEDWYALDNAETAGAQVYAVAAGTVVYVGGNYPGLVVIIQHNALFSMYGHLDPTALVSVGQLVERGALLGSVLRRADQVPNHLHFEIRTFLTTPTVNGATPRFGFRCGPNCAPGPGYWPIADQDLPADLGWRNPTHSIGQQGFVALNPQVRGQIVVAGQPISTTVPVWSAVPGPESRPQRITNYVLEPGRRFPLLAGFVPNEPGRGTSAASYAVWYQIMLDDHQSGWVQASVASTFETGADGRPASVMFNFLPINQEAP